MPALDLWPLLRELKIRTKGARTQNLDETPNYRWTQHAIVAEVERQYNAGLPVRIDILKARQLGTSTIVEAILFLWSIIHPGTFNLVLSKEKDDSEYLYTMTKRYYDLGPFHDLYDTQYYSKEQLVFSDPIASTIKVATAKKEEVGRGMTIHAAHCSEVSRWGDLTDTIIPGLVTAMPNEHGTIWILESTANGVGGFFYDTWQAAVAGESDFVPMFFPWYPHPEYEVQDHHLRYGDLDSEEEALVELMLKEQIDPSRILGKLAWRRKKIAGFPGGLDQFHEEHPTTPQEAFLSTGSNVFPADVLDRCYFPDVGHSRGYLYNDNGRLSFSESVAGHLSTYKLPDKLKRQRYVVAVDPTWTLEGDPGCIQVLNRATLEQCAVWRAQSDPGSIGQVALALAYFYNTALLNTEVQGGGRTVMQVFRDAHYRNLWTDRRPDHTKRSTQVLGWNTTHTTKNQLIGMTKAAVLRRQVVIHHPGTHYEMSQYVCLPTGKFGPARRSGHDDCVMAYMIAVVTCLTEAQSLDWNQVAHLPRGGVTAQGARAISFAGGGSPADHLGALSLLDERASPYMVDGEIEDWSTGWE